MVESGVGLIQHVLVSYSRSLVFKSPFLYTVVVDCGSLSAPSNGIVTVPITTLGSTATYTCNLGYQVTGLMVRMCSVSGWTEDDPVCTGEGEECIYANRL